MFLIFAPLAVASAADQDSDIAPAASSSDDQAPVAAAAADSSSAAAAADESSDAAAAVATTPTASDSATTELGAVAVTGTAIARTDAATALPVTVISIDQLKKEGITTTAQILDNLPENDSSEGAGFGIGANITGGASYASLRGLGPRHTLVLLNGRRLANNAFSGSAVDINTIPFGAIERVEVLRDGASALYGTDAVGGVINFITKKNLQGGSVDAGYELPTASGGGATKHIEATYGKGDLDKDGWNFMITGSYRHQDEIDATSRSGIVDDYDPDKGVEQISSYGFPANYYQGSSALANPASANGCSGSLLLSAGSDSACYFRYAKYGQVQQKTDMASVYTRGAYKFNDNNQVSLSYMFAHNESYAISAPDVNAVSIDSDSPYFPGNGITPDTIGVNSDEDVTLLYRNVYGGARVTKNTNTAHRIDLDFKGRFGGFHYDTDLLYALTTTDLDYASGYYNWDTLQSYFEDGTIDPFSTGDLTSAQRQAMDDAEVTGTIESAKGQTLTWNGKLTHELGNWFGAGQAAIAVGAQARREQLQYSIDNDLANAASSGGISASDPVDESRYVEGVYSELNVPLPADFELNMAARYDNYSDVGDTLNPKFSLRWQPIDQMVLRASYSEGFSAPTLYDLYDPSYQTYTSSGLNDPRYCPNGTAVDGAPANVCNQQFLAQSGGNKDLEPETSKSWTFGMVAEPLKGWVNPKYDNLSLSVDAWWVELYDTISELPATYVLDNASQYSSYIVRNDDGSINYINLPLENLGKTETNGIDFALNYHVATGYGLFSLSFNGTYTTKYAFQTTPGGEYYSPLGSYSSEFGGVIFRWKHKVTLGWSKGPWSANIVNHFYSHYKDEYPEYNAYVGAYSTWDMSGSYKFDNGIQLTLGSRNIFDTDPPFSNQDDAGQPGYDSRYASAVGRTVYVDMKYSF